MSEEEKPTYEQLERSLKWYQDSFSDYRNLCKQWHELTVEQDKEIRDLKLDIEWLEEQLSQYEEPEPAFDWGDLD